MIRILIADDSAPVRRGLRELLNRQWDWEVCGEASDGQEAVEKARQLNPDVVILDFSMPRLNGVEAAKKILTAHPKTSLLLCSMFLDSHLLKLSRQAGMLAAVSKSNVAQIVNGVKAALSDKQFVAARI